MTPLDAINQHRYTYFGFKDVSTAIIPTIICRHSATPTI